MSNLVIKNMVNNPGCIGDFTNNIIRLNETKFPQQFIKSFCCDYGQKFFNESDYRKAAYIDNEIAGLAFLASKNMVDSLTKQKIIDKYKNDLKFLSDCVEINEYTKQIDVILAIDNLIHQPHVQDVIKNKPELKMLSVKPEFQGRDVGKQLISAILHEIKKAEYWLVTDTNCNWKYYENKGYKLISDYVVTNDKKVPYQSIDGSIYRVMIYLWIK